MRNSVVRAFASRVGVLSHIAKATQMGQHGIHFPSSHILTQRQSRQPRCCCARRLAVSPSRRLAIRSGEDPQRRGERSLLDRPAAQGVHQRRLFIRKVLSCRFDRLRFNSSRSSAFTHVQLAAQ
jgi:hypothetical protein